MKVMWYMQTWHEDFTPSGNLHSNKMHTACWLSNLTFQMQTVWHMKILQVSKVPINRWHLCSPNIKQKGFYAPHMLNMRREG